jgi:hypothetical protein
MGRPRVTGQQLASPQDVVATTAERPRLMGPGAGGTPRDRERVTGTGPWDRLGEARVEVRWVDVQDWPGPHRHASVVTTDRTIKPQPLVDCDTRRGAIEPTFQACREDLQLESTTGEGQPTVLRCTPCVVGLSTLVVRRYGPLPRPWGTLSTVVGRGTSTVPVSAMLTCVRRA